MQLKTQAGFVLFAVLTATITEAQVAPPPQQPLQQQPFHRNTSGVKPSAISQQALPPSPAAPQVASSLLDQPAKPAQVRLGEGKLSVKADNSTLSGILHDISTKTGMTVDGLSRDQRIFGSYGPSAPREVLSALLDGLGYNVMMVGALENGAPRQLMLTPRTGAAVTGNHSMPMAQQQNINNNNGDDDDDASQDQQDSPLPPRPEPNPPEANQPQDQQQPPANPQVKTPQQMLQELQQLRQQQQQLPQQANPQ